MEGLGAIVQDIAHDNFCAVCLSVTLRCVRLGCGHPLCDDCLQGMLANNRHACPTCRSPMPFGTAFNECLIPSLGRLLEALRGPVVAACPDAAPLLELGAYLGRRWVKIVHGSRLERGGNWPSVAPAPVVSAFDPVGPVGDHDSRDARLGRAEVIRARGDEARARRVLQAADVTAVSVDEEDAREIRDAVVARCFQLSALATALGVAVKRGSDEERASARRAVYRGRQRLSWARDSLVSTHHIDDDDDVDDDLLDDPDSAEEREVDAVLAVVADGNGVEGGGAAAGGEGAVAGR